MSIAVELAEIVNGRNQETSRQRELRQRDAAVLSEKAVKLWQDLSAEIESNIKTFNEAITAPNEDSLFVALKEAEIRIENSGFPSVLSVIKLDTPSIALSCLKYAYDGAEPARTSQRLGLRLNAKDDLILYENEHPITVSRLVEKVLRQFI